MLTGRELLAAVRACPEDDAPRRAYADSLQEQGDPRGEFINLQLSLSRHDLPDEEREALARREQALLAEHASRWCGLVTPSRVIFARGFIQKVTCLTEQFLGAPFDGEPVRALTIEGPCGVKGAVALAQSRQLALLTSLDLSHNQIRARGAAALARSPHLAHLTFLNLSYNEIGDEGAAALAQSPLLAHLTHLDLIHNEISDKGAEALAQSPHLTRLCSLELSDNKIGEWGRAPLLV